mgnify:CR=1 FL=1
MNIQMRIITDDNIDQLLSMSYSNNVNKLLSNDDVDIKQIKQSTKKKLEESNKAPAVLLETPEGERSATPEYSPPFDPNASPEDKVSQQEASELIPSRLPVLEAKDYSIGDKVYYIEDPNNKRMWTIEELDAEYDAIVITSDDISELDDSMKINLSGDRLIATVEAEEIRKYTQSQVEPVPAQQPVVAQQQQGVRSFLPSVLNETIDTAQKTINNAQQTIQTAQKRITENISSQASPPFDPNYSPPFVVNPSPPFDPNESPRWSPESPVGDTGDTGDTGDSNLEEKVNVNTPENVVIKKENEGSSSSSSNDTDSETKDETVEKMEGGTIMNTALPTLTKIFSSITKKD